MESGLVSRDQKQAGLETRGSQAKKNIAGAQCMVRKSPGDCIRMYQCYMDQTSGPSISSVTVAVDVLEGHEQDTFRMTHAP